MLPAARYQHRVKFYRVTQTQNAAGDVILTVGAPVPARAKISWGTAAERREASGVEASQACTFRVHKCAALQVMNRGDRIDFDNATWGIIGVAIVGERLDELEFTTRAWRAGEAVAG
jgi:head-tail adaptor